jgi:hypothetical protein
MPALVGVIERYHQYWYDTYARGTGANPGLNGAAVAAQARLFSGGGLGNVAWTNMQIAGQFAGSRTMQVKALRVATFFRAGLNCANPSYVVHRLYLQCQMQLFWSLVVGDKPMFVAGTHYIPLGAGIYGDVGGSTDLVVLNNGSPTHTALLRLGRPIPIPPTQGFHVVADAFVLGAGDHSVITSLNNADDVEKDVKYMIDGLATREVQ